MARERAHVVLDECHERARARGDGAGKTEIELRHADLDGGRAFFQDRLGLREIFYGIRIRDKIK